MSPIDRDEMIADQPEAVSGFGGLLLTEAVRAVGAPPERPDGDGSLEILRQLGISDVEQLIGIAAIPEPRQELQSVLGLDDGSFQGFLDATRDALSSERAALVSVPASSDLGLGVLAPTPEMLAVAMAGDDEEVASIAIDLPRSTNLIPFMSPIRNQSVRGTCVAFALTALQEYVLRRRGVNRDLSEQHLYCETKQVDGTPNQCGTFQARAVIVLQTRGECREEVWPYNPNPPCNNHGTLPAQARSDGLKYRLATFAVPTKDVLAYKTHLSKQRPVAVSIPVWNSWYRSAEVRRSGRITMRIGGETAAGGHAVCLVGYQDDDASPGGGYFIVRNSWHTTWASQSPYGGGYGTIPYQYITNDAWEAFRAAAPDIMAEDDGSGPEPSVTGKGTVTIEVGSGIKITVSAT